jgi:Zn-dependent peptidase ImmA (M78 family)/transcriptional regulator with XRE-family HTH domain
MTEALVNADSLKAARKRAGLALADVAERMGQPEDKVQAWERGDARPTFVQAKKMANVLHVPFASLFAAPTVAPTVDLPDLRTVGGRGARARFSIDLIEVYQDALFKQGWVSDARREEAAPLAFVGAGRGIGDPAAGAIAIRKLLGIDAATRRGAPQADDFLRVLVQRAEAAGILVLRSSTVGSNTHRPLDVAEFRGFAISDEYAPLVFINTHDAKAAQVFTFIHELAHLWRAETGVSRPDIELAQRKHAEAEAFCDAVAAEALVPAAELTPVWSKGERLASNADRLRRTFKVSGLVVARRARDLGLVTQKAYAAYAAEEMARVYKRSGDSGPSFLTMVKLRNGAVVTEMVVRAVQAGRLLYRDASLLLGVQPPIVDKLAADGG